MKGKHTVRISDNRVRYELIIRRNITVIRGDSATGKTTMLEMLDNYVRLGYESGIHVECDVPVDAYMADDRRSDWRSRLEAAEGSIVFIEEMNAFIKTKEFAEYVSRSDSYYVLISRWDLKNLPYSVEEIYKLTDKGKYPKTKQVYNSLEKYYTFHTNPETADISKVITEDSGSGYEYFDQYCQENHLYCESADGNSNMIKIMRNVREGILCIADGAAFGSYIDECMHYLKYAGKDCIVWFPESFEYLILQSGIVKIPDLENILSDSSEYIDSKEFVNWERFFTNLLVEYTKGTELAYNKTELNDYYKGDSSRNRIEKGIPKEVLRLLKQEKD